MKYGASPSDQLSSIGSASEIKIKIELGFMRKTRLSDAYGTERR